MLAALNGINGAAADMPDADRTCGEAFSSLAMNIFFACNTQLLLVTLHQLCGCPARLWDPGGAVPLSLYVLQLHKIARRNSHCTGRLCW